MMAHALLVRSQTMWHHFKRYSIQQCPWVSSFKRLLQHSANTWIIQSVSWLENLGVSKLSQSCSKKLNKTKQNKTKNNPALAPKEKRQNKETNIKHFRESHKIRPREYNYTSETKMLYLAIYLLRKIIQYCISVSSQMYVNLED